MDEPTTSGAVNTQSKRKNPRKSISARNPSGQQTHSIQKKAVSKPNKRKCDIYVSNKSNFQVRSPAIGCRPNWPGQFTNCWTHFDELRNALECSHSQMPFFFQAQMNQCRQTLKSEANGEIFIHCLGNAINRGITLALKLVEESNHGLAYEANTSSIDLIGNVGTFISPSSKGGSFNLARSSGRHFSKINSSNFRF